MAWLDTGTHEALLSASNFVAVVEARQGLKIGAPEEASFRMGFIDADGITSLVKKMGKSDYADYLMALIEPGNA
jgi:glucose-1-phosphate thymidylyltransferase